MRAVATCWPARNKVNAFAVGIAWWRWVTPLPLAWLLTGARLRFSLFFFQPIRTLVAPSVLPMHVSAPSPHFPACPLPPIPSRSSPSLRPFPPIPAFNSRMLNIDARCHQRKLSRVASTAIEAICANLPLIDRSKPSLVQRLQLKTVTGSRNLPAPTFIVCDGPIRPQIANN